MTIKYTKEHEWIKVEGNIATIGISKHAADALGELVYVELPEVGAEFGKGDAFVVVESSKSASDVYAPVGGVVEAVNESLVDTPENVNNSSYNDGWMVKLKISEEIVGCMNEEEYKKYLVESE